jgi:hypothetical protein
VPSCAWPVPAQLGLLCRSHDYGHSRKLGHLIITKLLCLSFRLTTYCTKPLLPDYVGQASARVSSGEKSLASGWARVDPSGSQHLKFGSLTRSHLHPVLDALTDFRISHAHYGPLTDFGATRSQSFGDLSPCFRRMFPTSSFHHRLILPISRRFPVRNDDPSRCSAISAIFFGWAFLFNSELFAYEPGPPVRRPRAPEI